MSVLEQLKQSLAGRYDVERELGAGGMATVFLARDVKHDRHVAIKVLRPELAAALGPDRFIREIEIAAKLQHPHILDLFDSGEVEGLLYYVMPYVEGESLRNLIDREGPLPLDRALDVAREVASALHYAHERAIVHRDIKPANILLSGGHAMVADFGIARALSAGGGEGITQVGMAVGTAAYMSPEQATGSADEVDGRSDLYALGCVLFEMLTGGIPYEGPTVQTILSKSLSGNIPSVRKVRKDVPAAVDAVISKALARIPQDRFATGAEFAAAIAPGVVTSRASAKRLVIPAAVFGVVVAAGLFGLSQLAAGGQVHADAQVLAVMPFSTSGPDIEYLAEGMVDLMSTNLNGVGGIRTVDSRTVLHRWRGRAENDIVDLDGSLAIGRDVEAGSVLLGSVVSTGSGVRLHAELYSTNGNEMANVSVEGSADDVLLLVDSLSLRVLREVWRSNEPIPDFRLAGITTGSIEAIQEYLLGEQYYRLSQWDSSAAHFGRAIELDSTFALAQFKMSLALGWDSDLLPQSRQYIDASLRHAARLPEKERRLLIANDLRDRGRMESIDSLEAYLQDFPDDLEARFMYADAAYHARAHLGLSSQEVLARFDSVLALDSNLSPVLIHPLQEAIMQGDSARFFRYASAVDTAVVGGSVRSSIRLGVHVWSGDSITAATFNDVWNDVSPGATNVLAVSAYIGGTMPIDTLIAGIELLAREQGPNLPPAQTQGLLQSRVGVLLTAGRMDEASMVLDEWRSESVRQAAGFELFYSLFGVPGLDGSSAIEFFESLPIPNPPPIAFYFKAAYYLTLDRLDDYDRVRAGVADSSLDSTTAPLFQGLDGWALIARGDTTAGITMMRGALDDAGFMSPLLTQMLPLRLQLFRTMARYEPTRLEGVRMLGNDMILMAVNPAVRLELARVQEGAGLLDDAALSYGEFLRLYEGADPQFDDLKVEVRESLARVVSEPI